MDFLVKFRKQITILILLSAFYFILRLPNLTLQPIFADEAIYIRWAQVMRSEPTLRFLPQSDGKTPLFMWSMIPLFKVFSDPLFAGRFLSVMSGLATLLGVFALGWKVFGIRVGVWAALLYTITPYTVFFDRMALVDSMLSAFGVWALFFAILLAQKVRLDLAMILGFILGGGWLTKTPGVLNLILLPTSILAFKRLKADKYHLVKLIIFWLVAIFIALVMYNALRLGSNFHLLSSRNADYVFSPLELVGRPLDPFIPHFRDIADWFPKLITWPTIGLLVIGSWFIVKEKNKLGWVVLLWALIPLLLNMAFLKTFTARYLLASIPLLLVLGGFGITKLLAHLNKNFPYVLLLLILASTLYFNYYLLTDPQKAPLPKVERKGYLEEWTAGYGLSEIGKYLAGESSKQKIVVGTEGFFGTLPDGLYIYLDKANVSMVGSTATISAQIRNAAKDHPTFFVGNKKNLGEGLSYAKLIKAFPKANPENGFLPDATVLYQVLPR